MEDISEKQSNLLNSPPSTNSFFKYIVVALFITLPAAGFYAGMTYQKSLYLYENPIKQIESPTVTIPTISIDTPTKVETLEYNMDGYIIALTDEQYDKFDKYVKSNSNDILDAPSAKSQSWLYSDYHAQNHEYIARNKNYCEISHTWCGALLPENEEEETARCKARYKGVSMQELYNGQSNANDCCFGLISGTPHKVACVQIDEAKEFNKNLTYQVLKEAGVDCLAENCLQPLESTVRLDPKLNSVLEK